MGNTVKVKLLRTHVSARPGEIVIAFGHKFVMQPNGEVHCDMHKDFIPTEVAAGRVQVIEPGPAKEKTTAPELMQFSMEVSDYFGMQSIEKLKIALSNCRKEILREFASTRFSVDIPDSIENKAILDQIISLTKRAHVKYEQPETPSEEKTEEEDQEQPEKKSGKRR